MSVLETQDSRMNGDVNGPVKNGIARKDENGGEARNAVENSARGKEEAMTEMAAMMHAAMRKLEIPEGWELLPIDPNYQGRGFRLCSYGGTVLTNWHLLSGCRDLWARFQPRSSDIVVASFPKSGTTWLQEIVWRIIHLETGPSSGDIPLEYKFPLLDMYSLGQMQMQSIHDTPSPRMMKTHLPYHLLPGNISSSGAKILYISRDARDVCVSYYHFSRMVKFHSYRGTFQQYCSAFQSGRVMHGPYREHVKGYLEQADTVLCVTYEQLHAERPAAVRRVAQFLGRPLSDQQAEDIARHTSFDVMKDNPACNFQHWDETGITDTSQKTKFMRKGKVGNWSDYFSREENEAFMKWRNEPV